MQKDYIKCKCNQILIEKEFIAHFPRCGDFKQNFREFDTQFGKLLKEFSEPKENLLIIRVLLEQYKNVIENKIRSGLIRVEPGNGIIQNNLVEIGRPGSNNNVVKVQNDININHNHVNIDDNKKQPNRMEDEMMNDVL